MRVSGSEIKVGRDWGFGYPTNFHGTSNCGSVCRHAHRAQAGTSPSGSG